MDSINLQPIRKAILANAAFSTICGFALTVFPTSIALYLGVSAPSALRIIGIGLLIFVASLIHTATRPIVKRKQVQLIIAQDLLWVLASFLLLIIRPFGLSTAGLWSVDIIAILVGVFAYWQYQYLPKATTK